MIKSIVFYQSGEIVGTTQPKCFLENFQGDLNEMTTRLISHDWWEQTPCKMYNVKEIEIPAWMNEEQFLNYYVSYRFAVAYGMPTNVSEVEFFQWMKLEESEKHFVGWYLNKYKNTKNTVHQQIKGQIVSWLNGELGSNFSVLKHTMSYAKKYYPAYEYRRVSERIYNSF